MGLWQRLWGRKSISEGTHGWLLAPPTRSGVAVNNETAIGITAALCAARVIAEGVAQLPLKVMAERQDQAGKTLRTAAKDHPAYDLLHRRPNGWMTSFEFRETLTLHAAFTGNGVAIKNVVDGRIRELLPVRPDQLVISQDDNWNVRYEVRDKRGLIGVFGSGDVLHVRGPSWDAIRGLNIIKVAAEALGLSIAAERSQATLHKSGGRPSGILSTDSKLSPEAVERLKAAWSEKYGPGGEGGVAILDNAFSFAAMTMSAVDAQHIETRRFQIEEIARAFRVSPIMLQQADKASTYASAEQFFINHVIHTLGPWIERWEQAIDRDILGHAPEVYAHFQVQGMMRGAARDRGEFYAKALGSGGSQAWMTANDVRDLEDMNPHPDGDVLNAPSSTKQPAPADNPGDPTNV